jgi:lipoprotein NlpI
MPLPITIKLMLWILAGCSNHIQLQSNTNKVIATSTSTKQEEVIAASSMNVINQPTEEEEYQQALIFIKEKRYPQEMGILRRLGNYEESMSLLQQLRYIMNGSYICNGIWLVV